MYCKNCGNMIDDGCAFCPHCGASQTVQNQTVYTQNTQYQPTNSSAGKTNVLAIVGFILSFFCTIAGLICSIIGYKNAHEYGGNGKGLALAGIIISAVSIAISVLVLIIVLAVTGAFLGAFWY